MTLYLNEIHEGIYLTPPFGRMLWDGNATLIIKAIENKDFLNKPIWLVESNTCYGMIKLESVKEISLKEFEDLNDKHRMSQIEREKLFPDKKVLYAYNFSFVNKFSEPKAVLNKEDNQNFLTDVQFLEEAKIIEKKDINDIKDYNPTLLETKKLVADWNTILNWYHYYTETKGLGIKLSKEEITDLAARIHKELKTRIENEKIISASKLSLSKAVIANEESAFTSDSEAPVLQNKTEEA